MEFKNILGSNILTLANKFNKTIDSLVDANGWYDYKIDGSKIVITKQNQ